MASQEARLKKINPKTLKIMVDSNEVAQLETSEGSRASFKVDKWAEWVKVCAEDEMGMLAVAVYRLGNYEYLGDEVTEECSIELAGGQALSFMMRVRIDQNGEYDGGEVEIDYGRRTTFEAAREYLRDVRNAGGPGIGIAKQGQKLSYGGLSRQFAFGEMRTNASIKKVAKPRPLLPRDLSYLNDYPEVDRYISQSGLHYWINLAVREGLRKSQFYDLGNKLIVAADLAMDMRHAEGLEQTSRILTSALLPEEFQRIGQYYQALYLRVRGNVAASLALLTDLAESSATPLRYRARAMLAIAAHFSGIGNMDEALPFYLEAGYAASPRHGNDLYTTTGSQWMAAVAKGLNGDHRGALMDLERLLPSVQMVASVRPFYYFSYRNSLAVEQAELGQLEKAQHNIRVALGSPFAPNRPEWRETAEDVARKARRDIRSVVAINSAPPALS